MFSAPSWVVARSVLSLKRALLPPSMLDMNKPLKFDGVAKYML